MRKKNKKVNDPPLIERVAALETDMSWVKETLRKVDERTWIILASVILGIILTILTRVI